MYKTLQTIVDYFPENCILLIADQGNGSTEKQNYIEFIKTKIPCQYYQIPFDSGLSYARNFLINTAKTQNIPFVLLSADSIGFCEYYNFNPIIQFLNSKPKTVLVGFELLGSKCAWEFNIEHTLHGFQLTHSKNIENFNDILFKKIDICRNIFLAKTQEMIENPYDNELKLAEHETFFWNLKQKNKTCYWTSHIKFLRNSEKPNEYSAYRNRFSQYLQLALNKLNMDGWVIYPAKEQL
ncbi:MAG TPA: hypothetical protein VGB37_15255 [Candidatus Lokiarchaeia archaeon]